LIPSNRVAIQLNKPIYIHEKRTKNKVAHWLNKIFIYGKLERKHLIFSQ